MIQTRLTEEEIFKVAREISAAQARTAYLQQACGDDAALLKRVVDLLQVAEEERSFLEHPAAAYCSTITSQPITERAGDMIGPYRLMEQIGEGGFGLVFVAEQHQPVRRKVALKVIKPGMDTREVVARFEAERQALAMMDHPHIAKVLDAGTTESGRPYFVMELVRGVPITEYCDAGQLTPRERLQLFVAVCQAVQHAHQKGVIHRDLKPSNILVAPHDGIPVVKVIDFGVAKALGQQLTEKTVYTRFAQMIGTPLYMSPEQAEINALDVDTRSDVYALGVLLYELLTGTTPFDKQRLQKAAFDEIRRIIREEEPLRPSTRISTLGKTLSDVSAKRKSDPSRLSAIVRGELDWIVMKCLDKDRTRRYDTAIGLARDIQRYLSDEPVEACPPSLMYRLRKAARKHRGLLTTAASFLVLLVAGVIASTWLAAWAMREQQIAIEARQEALVALANERAAREEAVAARKQAEWQSKRLAVAMQTANEGVEYYYRKDWPAALDRFAKAAETEPDLYTIYVYRKMLYTDLGLWDRAAADYDRLCQLSARAHPQTCYEHALLAWFTGDHDGYRRACREIVRQYGESTSDSDRRQVLRACVLAPEGGGDPADAAQRARQMARQAEQIVTNNPAPWNMATAGIAHLRAGDFEKAAARLRETIDKGQGSPGGVHRSNYIPLSMALHRLGRANEAQDALTRSEEALDGWIREMLKAPVGWMPFSWWDWLEILLNYRDAKTLISGAPAADDPRLQTIRERSLVAIRYGEAFKFMTAGREHIAQNQWDQAAASFALALDQLPDELGLWLTAIPVCDEMVQRPEVFASLIGLRPGDSRLWYAHGKARAREGDWAQAASDLAKIVDVRRPERRALSAAKIELAAARFLAGDEAGYAELAAQIMRDHEQADDPFLCATVSRVCTLSPRGATDWAIPVRLANRSVEQAPRVAWYLFSAGAAQYRAGHDDEAVRLVQESLNVNPTWKGRAQNFVVLAMALKRLGRHDEARESLAEARVGLEEMRQTLGQTEFDVSKSSYSTDWLTVEVLLPEAERVLGGSNIP